MNSSSSFQRALQVVEYNRPYIYTHGSDDALRVSPLRSTTQQVTFDIRLPLFATVVQVL